MLLSASTAAAKVFALSIERFVGPRLFGPFQPSLRERNSSIWEIAALTTGLCSSRPKAPAMREVNFVLLDVPASRRPKPEAAAILDSVLLNVPRSHGSIVLL